MHCSGARTFQEIIDSAVHEFLAQLRESVPGFADAVEAAAANVEDRPENVTRLHPGS
jgi:hypothetical protein